MKENSLISGGLLKFVFVLIILFCLSSKSEAFLKNPFEPQIPAKESEIIAPPPPVQPETTKTPEVSSESELPLPALTITGVVWNSKRPQAIINENVVDVGDEIEGVKIIGIKKTAIDVMFQGREITIEP